MPSVQARSLILGRYGSPIEITVFRQVQSVETNASRSMLSIPFVIRRGVIPIRDASSHSAAANIFQSPAASSAHEHRIQGYSTVGPSVGPEECGIGVYVQHISGCFVVRSINPTGPASKIPPTNLSPGATLLSVEPWRIDLICVAGDYIVAIDGASTQGLSIQEVCLFFWTLQFQSAFPDFAIDM